MGKKSNPNKKTEIKKNKITNSKKITTNGGALLGRPTVVTVMHGRCCAQLIISQWLLISVYHPFQEKGHV